jgi:hypothetical protein
LIQNIAESLKLFGVNGCGASECNNWLRIFGKATRDWK